MIYKVYNDILDDINLLLGKQVSSSIRDIVWCKTCYKVNPYINHILFDDMYCFYIVFLKP
jgi:hypothetical protein